jgi:hypothetical protein
MAHPATAMVNALGHCRGCTPLNLDTIGTLRGSRSPIFERSSPIPEWAGDSILSSRHRHGTTIPKAPAEGVTHHVPPYPLVSVRAHRWSHPFWRLRAGPLCPRCPVHSDRSWFRCHPDRHRPQSPHRGRHPGGSCALSGRFASSPERFAVSPSRAPNGIEQGSWEC